MYTFIRKLVISLFLLLFVSISVADDIDIVNKDIPIDSNVLFIMDMSGSMKWALDGEYKPSDPKDNRKNTLQKALVEVLDMLDDPTLPNINVGIMSFSGNKDRPDWNQTSGGITYPVSPINSIAGTILDGNTNFDHPNTVDNPSLTYLPAADPTLATLTSAKYISNKIPTIWTPYGNTPILDGLYEAARYFRGNKVRLGKRMPDDFGSAHPSSYTGVVGEQPITNTDCPVGDPRRYSCYGPTCNATKSCTTASNQPVECNSQACVDNLLATDPTAVCGVNEGPVNKDCSVGDTFCHNATSSAQCTNRPETINVKCYESTAAVCESVNPGYYNCQSNEGGYFDCKKNVTIYTCPADKFSCTKDVESCTQCPDNQITGEPTYNSPIKNKCDNNAIILLSDGIPTSNNSQWDVHNYIGNAYNNNCGNDNSSYGSCGPELTRFLANEDNSVINSAGVDTVTGKQPVVTHTIGLALNDQDAIDYLKNLAINGNGQFVKADTATQLKDALYQTITASARPRSFSAPTYTINTSTFLTHDKNVFVPVFDRRASGVWVGNLKKYQLIDGEIYGKDDAGNLAKALDSNDVLKNDVRDLWATGPSSNAVTSGGAASRLNQASRNLLTDDGSSIIQMHSAANSLFNVSSSSEKNKLINYIRGEKPDGSSRFRMGDIIHSKPVQIMTSKTESVIYVGTNEGFLHAIPSTNNSSTDGKEIFAYMPRELLKNIKPQYDGNPSSNHIYGVDAPITLYHEDTNHNGIKENTEKATIFFGLRRGGKAIYALDVTDPSMPTLKWKITNTGSFANLGFTWSQPVLAMLKYKTGAGVTDPKPVLIFGGGYVDDHGGEADNSGTGANVYIVDAETGNLLLRIGGAINHAVPGKIRVIDMDRNGSVDRLYFADTGGNVWRTDLNADSSAPYDLSKAKLTKLAALASASPAAEKRKFFVEPDVSVFKHNGQFALSVSLGSGLRPDPLNETVNDQFFMILDENVFNVPPSSFTTITPSDLFDAPLAKNFDILGQLKSATGKKGWKFDFEPAATGLKGEKVLSTARTFQNKVLFTTFGVKTITTTTNNGNTCGITNTNGSRFYALDLLTGGAALDLDGDGAINHSSDNSVEVTRGEILETPNVVYGDFEAQDGTACTKDDCIRPFTIQVGNVPAVATHKTKQLRPVPINKSIPRVFWLDEGK